MPANKNQHFVPKCYLKPFTLNGQGRAINVYNLERGTAIKNAPVKNQCSGDYFYGSDLIIEKRLQNIEGEYSGVLARLHNSKYVLGNSDKEVIQSFWLLQYLRTEAASRRELELRYGFNTFIESDSYKISVSMKDTVRDAINRFDEIRYKLTDLKLCFFRNLTQVPFVTSDDPAVLANKWYAFDNRCANISHGLGSAGAIFVLPCSPTVLCIAYDKDVYSVQGQDGWIDLTREVDIQSFNQHQYVNCRENIYFHDWNCADRVQKESQIFSRFRLKARGRINFAVLESEDRNKKIFRKVDIDTARSSSRVLMHAEGLRSSLFLWSRHIAFRHGGKAYFGNGSGYVRSSQVSTWEIDKFNKIRTF